MNRTHPILFNDGPLDLVRIADEAALEHFMQAYKRAGHGFRMQALRRLQREATAQLARTAQESAA